MTTPPKHRRPFIRARDKIRQDDAGRLLIALAEKAGGVGALARKLACHPNTIKMLMRVPGRVPSDDLLPGLARESGESEATIKAILGPRRHRHLTRTERIIVLVREHFPRDPLRIAVVDHIEREHWRVEDYAAAVGMPYETLRGWLVGGGGVPSATKRRRQKKGPAQKFLSERWLLKIAEFEHIHPQVVADFLRQAKEVVRKGHLKAGKALAGTHHSIPRSDEARDKLSEAATRRWEDPGWLQEKGEGLKRKFSALQSDIRRDKDRSLAADIRLGVANFKQKERDATPADVLLIPLEVLPDRVEAVLGESLQTHIHATGRSHNVADIVAFVKRFMASPQPRPFFAEGERQRWNAIRDSLEAITWYGTSDDGSRSRRNLFQYVVETVAGGPVDMQIFRRDPGRPSETPSDEPENGGPKAE